jgi:DEAD/DEAH box helicase domain-containing protein
MTDVADPLRTDPGGPYLDVPDTTGAPGPHGAAAQVAIARALEAWADEPRVAHVRCLPPAPARHATPDRPLPADLAGRLPEDLWSHQARALDLVRAGTSVVLASGTASGKSLCYQVPAVEAALDGGTALLVFPTKALAQDQLQTLAGWDVPGVVAATYDGDCTPEERTWVRSHANVLLTNPEMLHQGILPNHARWGSFLHRCRLVVLDELHVLRGVFGTHVGQVLRRLRRLVRHYGGVEPTFVFTSATIGDPAALAGELCGRPVTAVTDDGSPRGERSVVLWNPTADPDDVRSANGDAAVVAAHLVASGLRTLVFCRSRRATELVAARMRSLLPDDVAGRVRSYRAGYLTEERREIEEELFGGHLLGVVATNALELGVDIGGLDAVVLNGYPGTVASFWQQVGRSGRSTRPSLAVVVAGQDQLDQWVVRHPDELFTPPPEPCVVNPDNPYVYVPHLACAAHEVPLRHSDTEFWPDQLDDGVRRLVLEDRASVRRRRGGPVAVWSGRGVPAPTIGLRSASRGEVRIVDTHDTVIGTVEEARAHHVVHEGAVYLHQGRAWRVVELDRDARRAVVEPDVGDTYTQARAETSIRLLDHDARRTVGAAGLHLGSVEVTSRVTGYQVRNVASHEVLDRAELDLPPTHLMTRAVWYTFDDPLVARAHVSPPELPGALHAAEHAAIGILPLFTICDRWDVGGVSTAWLPETGVPTVVVHDAHPGGAGIAELAYGAADRHLAATLEVLSGCRCADGCPSCVQSPKCGNGNEPLDKAAARRLLATTLGVDGT